MRTTGWRRIATGVWSRPPDPQIYGRIEVDGAPILDAIMRIRERTGTKVTVTHLVTRALGRALKEAPDVNSRLRFGRFVVRDSADVFVIVSTGAGKDLSGVKVVGADRKDVVTVARELGEGADNARAGRSMDIERGKHLLEVLPLPILRVALRVAAFLTGGLGWDLTRFGLPREAFGGAMVSSVGMFGISEGWAPLSPLYRVPLLVCIGEIRSVPWVEGAVVSAHPALTITASIDHRWVDGHSIARLAKTFEAYLADPLAFEPPEIASPRAETERATPLHDRMPT